MKKNHWTFICPDPIKKDRFPVLVTLSKNCKVNVAYCSDAEDFENTVANSAECPGSCIFVPESFAKEYGVVGTKLSNAGGISFGENGYVSYYKCNTDTFWMYQQ